MPQVAAVESILIAVQKKIGRADKNENIRKQALQNYHNTRTAGRPVICTSRLGAGTAQ